MMEVGDAVGFSSPYCQKAAEIVVGIEGIGRADDWAS